MIVFLFGIVGNVFSLVILSRKKLRSKKLVKPLMFLSIADILVLFCNMIPLILYSYGVAYFENNSVNCWLLVVLAVLTIAVSTWITVLITIERAVSICFPIINRTRSVRSCTKIFMVAILAFLIVFDVLLHYEWTMRTPKCIPNEQSNIYDHLRLCIEVYIPILILVVCNLAIAIRLHQRPKIGMTLSGSSRNKGTIKLVLIINITFVITALPRNIIFSFWTDIPTIYIFYSIILACTNNAINFVLYVIASKYFREEIKMICCRKRSSRQNCFTIDVSERHI